MPLDPRIGLVLIHRPTDHHIILSTHALLANHLRAAGSCFVYICPPSAPNPAFPHTPMATMRPFLCVAASSLASPSRPLRPSPSYPSPTVHPLCLQQARAHNSPAGPGNNIRSPGALDHRPPSPLCLTASDPSLHLRLVLWCPRFLHRRLPSLPFSPSRVVPRHPHQQAHKVVGRMGNVRGPALLTCSRTAQEAWSHRQSRSERVVYCGCQCDSRGSRLRGFTKGPLYASFHSFSTTT